MNRRSFLSLFGLAAAGVIVAPKTSYFLPPVGGWKSDIILRPHMLFGQEQWAIETQGLNFYDLRGPANLIYPVNTAFKRKLRPSERDFARRAGLLAAELA